LRRRQESPAYYDFIPVDSTFRHKVPEGRHTPRSELKKVYNFELKLTSISDIHVGSGKKLITEDLPPKPVLKFVRDGNGAPVIPGSSVKGVVSTNFLLLSGSSMMTSELFGTARGQPLISKVFFDDMRPIEKTELVRKVVKRAWFPKRSKRGHVKVYTAKAPPTAFFGFAECIPQGSTFATRVTGIDLRNFEVGGLIMSLGLYPTNEGVEAGIIRVGYGKPQGLGQLETIPEKSTFSVTEYDGFSSEIKTQNLTSDEAKKCFRAFIDEVQKREAKRDPIQLIKTYFRRF